MSKESSVRARSCTLYLACAQFCAPSVSIRAGPEGTILQFRIAHSFPILASDAGDKVPLCHFDEGGDYGHIIGVALSAVQTQLDNFLHLKSEISGWAVPCGVATKA